MKPQLPAPIQLPGLFLGLLLLVSPGCGDAGPQDSNNPPGRNLFIGELCASCHGFERQGSWMGPPLLELGEHWDRQALADFVRQPSVFVKKDQRIRDLARRFPASMTGNARLGDGDLLLLADWLLSPAAPKQ